MPVQIDWKLNVNVSDGPQVALGKGLAVEAFDWIEAKVPAAGAVVEVQPDGVQARFVLITSSLYSDLLTYDVEGGAEDVALDAPQLLAGAGAVGLLGAAPTKLTFTNGFPDPKPEPVVKIFIGRDA